LINYMPWGSGRVSLCERGDRARQNLEEAVDFSLRVEAAQTEAQQAASALGIVSHGEQYSGGFTGMMGAAGAAGGNRDADTVKRGEKLAQFPFPAAEPETQVAGQALDRMSEQIRIRKPLAEIAGNALAELRQAGSLGG